MIPLRFDAREEFPSAIGAALEVDLKYSGYVVREIADVERVRRQESVEIPVDLDFHGLNGLANEAKNQLSRLRPRTPMPCPA